MNSELEVKAAGIGGFSKAKTIFSQMLADLVNKAGGLTRSGKEALVVAMAKKIIPEAAIRAGLELTKLDIVEKDKHVIPFFNANYLDKVSSAVANHIMDNLDKYVIIIESDIGIYYDDNFIISLELKAFTENSMLKRFVYEANKLTRRYPTVKYAILQLENALGGDYASDSFDILGSPKAHAIMAAEDVYAEVLTLLNGKRSSAKAIHHPGESKSLQEIKYEIAVTKLANLLKEQSSRKHLVLR